jgi:hypothetical protein
MRKLRKREVMTVSRILEDVNFKLYAEYLLNNRIEKLLKSKADKKEKILIVMGDIFAFIMQNMHKAEDNIDILLRSYLNLSQEQVDDLEIDDYIVALKDVFTAGIPKVIGEYVNLADIKKKMDSAKEDLKK